MYDAALACRTGFVGTSVEALTAMPFGLHPIYLVWLVLVPLLVLGGAYAVGWALGKGWNAAARGTLERRARGPGAAGVSASWRARWARRAGG